MYPEQQKIFDFMVDPKLHSRGGYPSSVMRAFGRFPDAEIPAELRVVIDCELARAPTTEEEWADFDFLFGGTYIGSYEKICAELKDQYRKGVEVLRRRLGLTTR